MKYDQNMEIPDEISEAADKLRWWTQQQGLHDWELRGVCDRSFVDKHRMALELSGTLLSFIKVNTLRGTFKEASYAQVEEAIQPYIRMLFSMQTYPAP
jgi:hypothetical protein